MSKFAFLLPVDFSFLVLSDSWILFLPVMPFRVMTAQQFSYNTCTFTPSKSYECFNRAALHLTLNLINSAYPFEIGSMPPSLQVMSEVSSGYNTTAPDLVENHCLAKGCLQTERGACNSHMLADQPESPHVVHKD